MRRTREIAATVLVGAVRAGFGALIVSMPDRLARVLGTDRITAKRGDWLGRMIGVRELALGLGCLDAVRRGDDPRPWLVAQTLSDTGDAATLVEALRRGRVSRLPAVLTIAFAVSGVAGQTALVRRLTSTVTSHV